MRIVTNGEHYAIEIRSFLFWKKYLDLSHHQFTWTRNDLYFKDCITSDFNKVCRIFKERQWEFRPIKDICDCQCTKVQGSSNEEKDCR